MYERIRNMREDRDKSQNEIANILSISQRAYSHYELGTRGIPVDILIKLADYYECSIDYLVGRTNTKTTFFINIMIKNVANVTFVITLQKDRTTSVSEFRVQ
jgi:transcriptional regulator with XRE-family HTH domain